MSEEILPCPFCGQELERTAQKINQTARCVTEGCRGGKMPSVILESPQDVAAWNTRHAPEGFALVPLHPQGGALGAMWHKALWSAPEGYALVPVEANKGIKDVFCALAPPVSWMHTSISIGDFDARYRMMVAYIQEHIEQDQWSPAHKAQPE